MRAIPIDSFFERLDDGASAGRLDPSAYDWARIVAEGRAARGAADGGRWRIGGLALMVERRYASGALQRFASEIAESYGTVRRYRWVAKAYDPIVRERFSSQSFSHFQAVAGLPDRLTWLERAARGTWSVDRLSRESREKTKPNGPKASRLDRVRTSIEGMKRSLRSAVELDDAALARAASEWLEGALDDLARELELTRERVRRATRAAESRSPLNVARASKQAPKSKAPTALKARAIGR